MAKQVYLDKKWLVFGCTEVFYLHYQEMFGGLIQIKLQDNIIH